MIGVVALLVIGPERLPGVARSVGVWVGRGRRLLNQVKSDVSQEIKAEELKRILEQQKQNSGLEEILETTRTTMQDFEHHTKDSISKAVAAEDKPAENDAAEKSS